MMEPLSTFSLACGIIQVLDFSTKLLWKCKDLYEDGALHDFQDLEDITKRLTNLRIDLQLPSDAETAGTLKTPNERGLLDAAKGCSAIADQLVGKLDGLKVKGPHRKRQAVMKGIKAICEKNEIQDAQKQLANYQNVLNTKILVDLRFVQIHIQVLFFR